MVLDNSQYIQMCLKILSNEQWYRNITLGMVLDMQHGYCALIDEAHHDSLNGKPTWQFVLTDHPCIQIFYA